jgi:molecular chaperone HscB
MPEESCWRCGEQESGSLFCRYCNSLQQPTPDYFTFLELPHKLGLDTADLQRKFYSMSRMLHPDKYTRATDREREYSLEATAILNDGYRILRDPVMRAEYVLKEQGFDIGEQRSKDVPPELLEEVFDLNLALDELRSGDDQVLPLLEHSRAHFDELRSGVDSELETEFRAHDAAADAEGRTAVLQRIRSILNRRRYISNLLSEVDKELAARRT